MQPGTYTIRVEAQGFRPLERKGNVLTASDRLSVGSLELTIGAVGDAVTVTAQGAAVQAASSERSALVSATQVEKISVRGRDAMSLLRLLPGVSYQSDPDALGASYGTATPNIQGTRNGWNTMSVDGLTGNNPAAPSVFGSTVSLDAIAEVNVQMGNYQAEYGRNGGAAINLVTKSGSRQFHGTGYWYVRNEDLNANDFFNNLNGQARPLYRFNTEGFTLGGPVPGARFIPRTKDRLFFFYSFEDLQTKTPQALQRVTVPTDFERAGNYSQTLDLNGSVIPIKDPLSGSPFPGNIIPKNRISANGLGILNVFPEPNALSRSLTQGNYNYVFQESLNVPKSQHMFRTDYRLTDKDAIYVRGLIWNSDTQGSAVPAGGSTWGLLKQHYDYSDESIVVNYTHIFSPTVINEFSGGARYDLEKGPPLSAAQLQRVQRSTYGINMGQFSPQWNPLNVIPQASFGGVPNPAAITFDGRWPIYGSDTNFDFTDGLTVVRGGHSFKAGVFVQRLRNEEGNQGTFSGNFDFSRDVNNPNDTNYAYSNALLGGYRSYVESTSRPQTHGRAGDVEWYVQDSWKVNRRLTLDYGLRFGWYTQWAQRGGQVAAFSQERYNAGVSTQYFLPTLRNGARVGLNPVTGQVVPAVYIGAFVPGTSNPINGMVLGTDPSYPSGFKNQRPPGLEPRFGFAYDVFGDGKTAVRGSFGVFREKLITDDFLRQILQNPPIQYNPNLFYGNVDSLLSSQGLLFPSSVIGYSRDAKTPTLYDFTLGVQRDIGRETVLDVAYVGNLGRHLQQGQNINLVPYGAHFLPQNADPANPAIPLNDNFFRPYPGYGNISFYQNTSTSNYNAMQATLNRRFTHGVQFGLSYTWSKAMDFTDTDGGTVATYQSLRTWNYGKAGFDQTHIFVANYTWDLPKGSRIAPSIATRLLLDNWQISGITSFISGTPSGVNVTLVDGADISGGGDGFRTVVTGNAELPFSDRSFTQFFTTSVFKRPAQGSAGNAPKDVFRGPGIANWDMSLFKKFPIGSEQRFLQLRWELYNAFNHTQFASVDNNARFDAAGNQVNTRFGQVISTRTPRVMQLSLRFTF